MADTQNVNPFLKRIEQCIWESNFDDNIMCAIEFHLKVLASSLKEDKIIRRKASNIILSKFILDKIHMLFPKKRFTCQVEENSDYPISLLPLELFGKEKFNESFRKMLFYKSLQIGDVLDCRVTSILPTEYHLKVVHKYGGLRFLEDLNIIVSLPLKEGSFLSEEFIKTELVKGAVCEIKECEETIVIITIDDSVLQFKRNKIKLGRISEDHLPSYALHPPDVSGFESYIDYLNSLRGFHNHLLFQDMDSKFGINRQRVYSFYSNLNSMQYAEESDGQLLLKEAKKDDCAKLLQIAIEKYKKGNAKEALKLSESAIEVNSKCPDIYLLRAKLYSDIEGPRLSMKAVLELERAYLLDHSNIYVKNQLSKAVFIASNVSYQDKKYFSAAQLAIKALELNENNSQASALLEYLKDKHSEEIDDLKSEILHHLQKKKRIVSKSSEIDIELEENLQLENPDLESEWMEIEENDIKHLLNDDITRRMEKENNELMEDLKENISNRREEESGQKEDLIENIAKGREEESGQIEDLTENIAKGREEESGQIEDLTENIAKGSEEEEEDYLKWLEIEKNAVENLP